MKRLQTALILAVSAALRGTAEEPALVTNESPAAARSYTNTVQLYEVDLGIDGPRKRNDAAPTAGDEAYDPLRDQGITAPMVAPAAPKRVPAVKKKSTEEKNASGWGWLADDVAHSKKADESKVGDKDGDRDAEDRDQADADDKQDDERTADRKETTTGTRKRDGTFFIDSAFEPTAFQAKDDSKKREDKKETKQGDASSARRDQGNMKQETPAPVDANVAAPSWLSDSSSDQGAAAAAGQDLNAALAPSRVDEIAKPVEATSFSATPFEPAISEPTAIPGGGLSVDSLSSSFGLRDGAVDSANAGAGFNAGQAGSDASGYGSTRFSFDKGSDSLPAGADDRHSLDSSGGFGDQNQPKALPW